MNHTEEFIEEIIGLLIGLAIFVIGIRYSRKRQKLIKNGKRVKATIIELAQNDKSVSNSVYYPVLQFVTASKEKITVKYHTGYEYDVYAVGKQVIVIYNKANAEYVVIDDLRLQLTGPILTVVGIIAIVFSVAFMVFFMMI